MGKVTVKTEFLESTRAVVAASFLNQKQPTTVTYDFVREDGAWKIDDIKGAVDKDPWSIRAIVEALKKFACLSPPPRARIGR